MGKYGTNVNTKIFRDEFVKRLTGLVQEYKSTHYDAALSDIKFCEKVGLSYETYKAWKTTFKTDAFVEKYARYPKYDKLIWLADLFGVSIDYLTLREDAKSTKHAEIDFNIKSICEKTGLSENVTTQLYAKNPYFEIMPKFINYFFETSDTLIKLLKTYSVTDWTKKSNDELQALLDKILNVMIEENESKKDSKRIYASKRFFLRYMYFYVFEKVSKIAYSDEKHRLQTIDREVVLLNEFSQENGIIGNNYTIDAQLFDKFYLDTSLKYLAQIKDHFEKYDYEKTHTRQGIIPKK